MNNLANAFGAKFSENKDLLRTRSFEMAGHTFKVKVPLTSENEAMQSRIKQVDEATVAKYYDEMSKPFLENQKEFEGDESIKFVDGDVIIKETSLKETARSKAITENRILELFKMLVPEADGFDMSTITYDMIEELFPFSIQLQIIEAITQVISPSYKATRGN